MIKLYIFIFLVCSFRAYPQSIDFNKMKEIYEARQPALDKMKNYPKQPYKSLSVLNGDGIKISFWWLPQNEKEGTILLVHGFMMNKSLMLGRGTMYHEMNKNVILIDLRARGESGGEKTTSGQEIKHDILAVASYYKTNLSQYGKLSIHGYSHGGRAAVFAAEDLNSDIESIILESIPYSLEESFKRTFKIKEVPDMNAGDINTALDKISYMPILLLFGTDDTAIIKSEAKLIASKFKNPVSQLVEFQNAGHDLTLNNTLEKYKFSISTFLNQTQNK